MGLVVVSSATITTGGTDVGGKVWIWGLMEIRAKGLSIGCCVVRHVSVPSRVAGLWSPNATKAKAYRDRHRTFLGTFLIVRGLRHQGGGGCWDVV
jgi:hypothetical protein